MDDDEMLILIESFHFTFILILRQKKFFDLVMIQIVMVSLNLKYAKLENTCYQGAASND